MVGVSADGVAWFEPGATDRLMCNLAGQTTEIAQGTLHSRAFASADLSRFLVLIDDAELVDGAQRQSFTGYGRYLPLDPYLDALWLGGHDTDPDVVVDVASGNREPLEMDPGVQRQFLTDDAAFVHTISTVIMGVPYVEVFEAGLKRARIADAERNGAQIDGGFGLVRDSQGRLVLVAAGHDGTTEVATGVQVSLLSGDWSDFNTTEGVFARRLR